MTEASVALYSDLAQGMTEVQAGETKLLLVRDGSDVRAFEAECPHAKAPLAKGALCRGRIICPWHMAAFDARSGALLEPVAMRALKAFPVRIAGDAVVVTLQAMQKTMPAAQPDSRRFVLAGSGAAAAMAAVTLRDAGFNGRLTMIGPDAAEPLDRTQLSKMALASAEFDRGTLPLFDDAMRARLAIGRVVGSVVSIDPAARTLTLSTGASISYDAVLLATGAAPVPLDVPGAGRPNVCVLRTLGDVDAMLPFVREGGRASVLGTSFIGMEAAAALAERGMAVTVIGKAAVPFAKLFGERVGRAIQALHESKGVVFRLGTEVRRVDDDGVGLASGEAVGADLIVAGLGVRPVLDYAGGLPRAKSGGLHASASLQVADAVWAAGDIAAPAGWPRIEHWRLAQQHGRVAALAMLGQPADYEGVPFFWSAQHGKRLDYVGHAAEWDEIVFDGDVEGFDFIAWYVKDGAVAAALTCARDPATALLSDALRSPLTLEQARMLVS